MLFTLVNTYHETPDVITFVWQPTTDIVWKAGQFIKFTLPHDNMDDRGASRWFTIAAAPWEKLPRITTRMAQEKGSTFKTALALLEPGTTIEASGAMGGFVLEEPYRGAVLIAGGIGITPYRSMLLQLDHDNVSIEATLMYANRDVNFVFKSELIHLSEKHTGFTIHESIGPALIEVSKLKEAGSGLLDPLYFVSGPELMVDAYVNLLGKAGIDEANIKTDSFPGYN